DAEYQALRERMAGYAPPLEGDIMQRNAQVMAGYAPAVGGTIGAVYGGARGAAAGGAAGELINLAANPAARSRTVAGKVGQVAAEGALMGATELVMPPLLRAGGE